MDGAYLLGIGFCGYGILTGTMSYGNLMAIMQLVGQVQSPFANLTGYLPRYYSMLASAERLMEAEAFAPAQHPKLYQKHRFYSFTRPNCSPFSWDTPALPISPRCRPRANRLPCRWFCRMSA